MSVSAKQQTANAQVQKPKRQRKANTVTNSAAPQQIQIPPEVIVAAFSDPNVQAVFRQNVAQVSQQVFEDTLFNPATVETLSKAIGEAQANNAPWYKTTMGKIGIAVGVGAVVGGVVYYGHKRLRRIEGGVQNNALAINANKQALIEYLPAAAAEARH